MRAAGPSRIISRLVAGTFFVLYYLYVHECLDPRLLYHADQVALPSGQVIDFPIYLQGAAFLREFLVHPGGLAEYVAARCCQYYYYPHLGPLILTAGAWLVCVFTDWLIKIGGGGGGSRGLRFVPPLLLLVAYNQYTFRLESVVALVAALMLATFYNLVANQPGKAPLHFLLFGAVSVPLYYAAGGLYLLFAVLCALPELLARRRYVLGGLYLLGAAGIPLEGKYVFGITLADAYFRPCGVHSLKQATEVAVWAVYLFFVLVAMVLPFRQQVARMASVVVSRAGKIGTYLRSTELRLAGSVLALVAASASVALYTLDKDARTALRANYLARREMWPEFLAEVEHYPGGDYPASLMVDINRALFETGQLGSRMFSYPQNPRALFGLGPKAVSYKGGCEVLLRLGRINEAEHAALEALEINGERPETLRQLALVYMVKRQPDTARVFLGVLSRDIIHGPWAADCLRRLEQDPLMSSDREIQYLRSVMPVSDMVTESKEAILVALLGRNPKNRMALEYLMAYYLLTRQPGKVALNIGRLEEFDYPTIPEHYAEAILLYAHNVGSPGVLDARTTEKIEKHALDRAREVIRIAQDCGGDKKAIAAALAARYPNSCCRYLLTGRSGGAG